MPQIREEAAWPLNKWSGRANGNLPSTPSIMPRVSAPFPALPHVRGSDWRIEMGTARDIHAGTSSLLHFSLMAKVLLGWTISIQYHGTSTLCHALLFICVRLDGVGSSSLESTATTPLVKLVSTFLEPQYHHLHLTSCQSEPNGDWRVHTYDSIRSKIV